LVKRDATIAPAATVVNDERVTSSFALAWTDRRVGPMQSHRRFLDYVIDGDSSFLPRVGIDASTWSDERLDELFNTYLVAYEAVWRSFPDAEPCLRALRRVVQIAVLSNGNQQRQEQKVSRTGLGRHIDIVLTSDQLGVAKPGCPSPATI
jgi:FMN phosphatase YigB (HAD superfamily)